MKYYEMHEIVYKALKRDNEICWDKSSTYEEMWEHSTNTFLKKYISQLNMSFHGLDVLDLGTGTGTSALYTAKEGARSVGVELSESALEIARRNATALALDVEFLREDILNLALQRNFDLIIDSTVLHCIVGVEDRMKFFKTVKRHLRPDGYLFFNTMIAVGNGPQFPDEYFHYEDDILWSLGIDQISERKEIAGKSFFAHRTILPPEKQTHEFEENGFQLVFHDIIQMTDISCMTGMLKLK